MVECVFVAERVVDLTRFFKPKMSQKSVTLLNPFAFEFDMSTFMSPITIIFSNLFSIVSMHFLSSERHVLIFIPSERYNASMIHFHFVNVISMQTDSIIFYSSDLRRFA